jgi:hypothetical protein
VFAPLEREWCDLYLDALRPIVAAPAENPGAEIVIITKLYMNIMVGRHKLAAIVQRSLVRWRLWAGVVEWVEFAECFPVVATLTPAP